MKKNYTNKMMTEKKEKIKRLIVLKECEAPGIGAWKAGDVITDPKIICIMKENPNFEPMKEGK